MSLNTSNINRLFQVKSNVLTNGGVNGFTDSTSFLFDGVDDYMETDTNYTMLDNSLYFTINLWVKLNDTSTAQRILFLVGGRRIFIYVTASGKVDCSIRSSTYNIQSNSGSVPLNTWTNIIWTYDGTLSRYNRYQLYVNGVSNVSTNNGYTSTILPFTAPLNVGLLSGRYLNANINELSFWNVVLSPTQVTEVYNNGEANNLNDLPTATQPNNWWRSENAVWNGTNFNVPDENGLFPITTSNMTQASIVTDVPT